MSYEVTVHTILDQLYRLYDNEQTNLILLSKITGINSMEIEFIIRARLGVVESLIDLITIGKGDKKK